MLSSISWLPHTPVARKTGGADRNNIILLQNRVFQVIVAPVNNINVAWMSLCLRVFTNDISRQFRLQLQERWIYTKTWHFNLDPLELNSLLWNWHQLNNLTINHRFPTYNILSILGSTFQSHAPPLHNASIYELHISLRQTKMDSAAFNYIRIYTFS